MKEIIEKLDKAIIDLVNECGTDSYRIRCDLYDILEKLKAAYAKGIDLDKIELSENK